MGHCGSARAFAVNPARIKAPLRASGVDRSARPSKAAIMPRMRRSAFWKGCVPFGAAECFATPSSWSLGHGSKKRLTSMVVGSGEEQDPPPISCRDSVPNGP
jgi:hypothetical protein